jgi:NADH:ubiquinone oxidoreductase subunit K
VCGEDEGSSREWTKEGRCSKYCKSLVLTVAAAESAIGLAILVQLFRNKSSINVDELNTLKG